MPPTMTACPSCTAPLKLPTGAAPGRQIRCPGCKHVFEVPAVPTSDRAESETQQLDGSVDRAAVETQRLEQPQAEDGWGDADAQAVVRRTPQRFDDENDNIQSYGIARGAGEPPPLIGKVGRFELRKFLGQGAFGKVYLAHDPQLDRAVALKVPRHPPTDDRGVRQFMVEATSAARLKHPNIVAIYEAAQAGSTLYIASEYVEGVPLSVRLAERPPKPRLAVRWVRDLAQALQYAHELGVTHRDVKPANVMIGREDRPQLMDFGLALRRDAESFSEEQGLVGTPAYVAPEQARGEQSEVGPKSDQFSLGAVFYELLTGVTPFRGPLDELLRQVKDPEFRPPPPNRLKPEIPADLAAICMKALSKQPGKRYRIVGDLAADLQRWLDGKRVLAGKAPVGSGEAGRARRGVRWLRRSPRRTGAIFAALFLLAGGVVGGLWVRERIREANRKMEEVRRTEMARDADLFRERGARLGGQGKPAEGVAFLARSYELATELEDVERQKSVEGALGVGSWNLPPPPGLTDDAVKTWWLAGGLAFGVPVPDAGEGRQLADWGLARFTGYGAGGARVLTAEGTPAKNGTTANVQLRDAATKEAYATFPPVNRLTFSPDAKRVFHGGPLTWGLWDSESRTDLGVKHDRDKPKRAAEFSADGLRLVVFGMDRTPASIEVWDVARAKLTRNVPITQDNLGANGLETVAISRDGKTLAIVAKGTICLWSIDSKEMKREFFKSAAPANLGSFTTVAFTPDGSRLAVAYEKGTELWTTSGERIGLWLPAPGVTQIVFSPVGRHVALLGKEGVRLWDVAATRPIGPPRHRGATRVQFRPDGKELLTVSDNDVRVWRHPTTSDRDRGLAARLWAETTTGLEVAPDGQLRPLSEADRTERRGRFEQLAGLESN